MNVTNNHMPLNVLSISAAYKRNGRLLSVAQSLQAVEPLLARFGVEPYCKRQHNSNEPCKSQYQCFHILNFLVPCCQRKRTGMLFFYTSKRTPFTLQKDSFYTPKGLLLHNKCTPFGMQKGYIYFSSVIFGLFSHYFSAFQPLFIDFSAAVCQLFSRRFYTK